MGKVETIAKLKEGKLMSIFRVDYPEKIEPVIEALILGGMTAVEITMNSRDPFNTFAKIAKKYSKDIILGMGTVLDSETARLAILEGAQVIISPIYSPDLIQMAHRYNVPVLVGAFSPTEIVQAAGAGADMVKIFPASVLGMDYIKTIKMTFPAIDIFASGGIAVEDAGAWINSGAAVIDLGRSVVSNQLIETDNYKEITERVKKALKAIKEIE